MNRNQLKTILKINGLSEESPEDEIRAVLSSARYSDTEIESALVILRDSSLSATTRVEGLHSVLYRENTLRASEIVTMLGVDVNLESPRSGRVRDNRITTFDGFLIIGLAIMVAAIGIVSYMYFYNVGIFYSEI